MNWNRTKNIFIICFLILDLFLGFRLYERQLSNLQMPFTSDMDNDPGQQSTIEPEGTLPKTPDEVQLLVSKQMNFLTDRSKADTAGLKYLAKKDDKQIQTFEYEDNGLTLKGTFTKPIKFPDSQAGRSKFLSDYIFHGGDYQYWQRDKENNVVSFTQLYSNTPIYSVSTDNELEAGLNIQLNKNGEAVSYTQVYYKVTDQKTIDDQSKILSAQEAISQIADQTYFYLPDSPTASADFIYANYPNVSNESTFFPAWHVTVHLNEGTDNASTKQYVSIMTSNSITTLE